MTEQETGSVNQVHIPILTGEILNNLNIKEGDRVIDATADGGGHSTAIAGSIGKTGSLLAIERDAEMVKYLSQRIKEERLENISVVCGNFKNIGEIAKNNNLDQVDAVIFDIGMSNYHIRLSGRGFTFKNNEPLDMRFSEEEEMTAKDVVNNYPKNELEQIIKVYGQERFARSIAGKIEEARKHNEIRTTEDLLKIIKRAVPSYYIHGKIHYGTRTFQALRIFINDELDNIKEALEGTVGILKTGGRVGVISFHSLEDKIVKEFGKQKRAEMAMKIITKKPIIPTDLEIKKNPQSRSAKLRVFEKTG